MIATGVTRDLQGHRIVAVSSVSLALLAIQRRVHEHRWKDLLESFFILNLGIFSVAKFYIKEESKDSSQFLVSSISIGIAFITLMGIITLLITSAWYLNQHPTPGNCTECL